MVLFCAEAGLKLVLDDERLLLSIKSSCISIDSEASSYQIKSFIFTLN